MIITIILILLAGFFKAVADTLQHHFSTSIFKHKDPRFWDPKISWQHIGFIRFTKYRPDAWHLANSLMIFCLVGAAASSWIEFIVGGVLFNVAFNIFYNKLLKR